MPYAQHTNGDSHPKHFGNSTPPNNGVQATAYSLRSFFASASGSA